jgi:hypothetical protein
MPNVESIVAHTIMLSKREEFIERAFSGLELTEDFLLKIAIDYKVGGDFITKQLIKNIETKKLLANIEKLPVNFQLLKALPQDNSELLFNKAATLHQNQAITSWQFIDFIVPKHLEALQGKLNNFSEKFHHDIMSYLLLKGDKHIEELSPSSTKLFLELLIGKVAELPNKAIQWFYPLNNAVEDQNQRDLYIASELTSIIASNKTLEDVKESSMAIEQLIKQMSDPELSIFFATLTKAIFRDSNLETKEGVVFDITSDFLERLMREKKFELVDAIQPKKSKIDVAISIHKALVLARDESAINKRTELTSSLNNIFPELQNNDLVGRFITKEILTFLCKNTVLLNDKIAVNQSRIQATEQRDLVAATRALAKAINGFTSDYFYKNTALHIDILLDILMKSDLDLREEKLSDAILRSIDTGITDNVAIIESYKVVASIYYANTIDTLSNIVSSNPIAIKDVQELKIRIGRLSSYLQQIENMPVKSEIPGELIDGIKLLSSVQECIAAIYSDSNSRSVAITNIPLVDINNKIELVSKYEDSSIDSILSSLDKHMKKSFAIYLKHDFDVHKNEKLIKGFADLTGITLEEAKIRLIATVHIVQDISHKIQPKLNLRSAINKITEHINFDFSGKNKVTAPFNRRMSNSSNLLNNSTRRSRSLGRG